MDTKIKPGTPFRSALLMMAAISALATSMQGVPLQLAINALGPYAGRGKGRGIYSGKKQPNKSGRAYESNGVRERARRVRQIEKGMLQCTA